MRRSKERELAQMAGLAPGGPVRRPDARQRLVCPGRCRRTEAALRTHAIGADASERGRHAGFGLPA